MASTSCSSVACNKAPDPCRDNDKASDNPALPANARQSLNRCNLPAAILGSLTFQKHPSKLELDGVAELHRELFRLLDARPDPHERAQVFHDYMTVHFRLEALEDAGLTAETKKNRAKLSYLKLIRGWHFNSDQMEGAVLKAWVESRFGLLPRYHGAPIRDPGGDAYQRYQMQRAAGLYNTNALEAQLDLVYTYTQHELRCRFPDKAHFRLYRGVNGWQSHEKLGEKDGETLVLLNNVNSFSSDAERAGEFGDTVFATDVPCAKIICCAEVLPGKLQGEGEFLVIGGVYGVRAR
ncbi:NAD+---dinitrogen-reductase ADP-D-ribosyltransferase [Formivibrio citricus]|uniref:NAD+---dinitrogen-reductase ADP-D-ribosyltransferase n=1 Tax=Formivibrio citricus TaxID=83765 RepID=A0A1I4Z153_9NEIS|nr:NAD(+)--dinitrogen-reductase ADP-D-ribosyltransferase [Formivibrio citricus]SFN43995.1 NAD+---dinitrogen-reductase ADP-D-ribosyltransferase [Formivibrio citricus]